MKQKQSKKPTMNEVKNAISNILVDMSYMSQHLSRIDSALAGYIKFKNDSEKYNKWLETKVKEKQNANKEGTKKATSKKD